MVKTNLSNTDRGPDERGRVPHRRETLCLDEHGHFGGELVEVGLGGGVAGDMDIRLLEPILST